MESNHVAGTPGMVTPGGGMGFTVPGTMTGNTKTKPRVSNPPGAAP
jgi:hypothetical protein